MPLNLFRVAPGLKGNGKQRFESCARNHFCYNSLAVLV
jgi:hypothetical protein